MFPSTVGSAMKKSIVTDSVGWRLECVALLGPDIEWINREAPSLSFLQEKIKH